MRNKKATAISKVFIEQEVYYEVGQNGVVEIRYHVPEGDGDTHYCDIYTSDKIYYRLFRPDFVRFED